MEAVPKFAFGTGRKDPLEQEVAKIASAVPNGARLPVPKFAFGAAAVEQPPAPKGDAVRCTAVTFCVGQPVWLFLMMYRAHHVFTLDILSPDT